MSNEPRNANRKRARLLGRSALAIGIAPAFFFVWNSIGLPGIPGIDFGGGNSAQADPGLVVRIADTSPRLGRVTSLRPPVHVATAHRPRAAHAAVSSVSPKGSPAPATESKVPPARTTDAAPTTDPPAPTAPVRRPAAPAAPAPPVETTVTETTSTIALPALPQLPAVQTPPIPIPIPSVLPALPLVPVVPVLPPVGTGVLP